MLCPYKSKHVAYCVSCDVKIFVSDNLCLLF